MNPAIQDAFSGSTYYLQIPSTPQEISFTGQSPTAATAAPTGTGFIQGSYGGLGNGISPIVWIALLALGFLLLRNVR